MEPERVEQAKALIAELNAELSRPVPQSYGTLIARSLKEDDPIFYALDQQLAPGIIGKIDSDPSHKARFVRPVSGKDFIDIGCGEPQVHCQVENRMKYPSVAAFAQALGASRYIGVDRYSVEDEHRGIFTGMDQTGFKRVYLGGLDFLEFLSRIPDADKHPTGKLFFVSGLESLFGEFTMADEDERVIGEYHKSVYDEFARVTKQGDAVYLGPRTKSLKPEELVKRGFKSDIGLNYTDTRYSMASSEGRNRVDLLIKE